MDYDQGATDQKKAIVVAICPGCRDFYSYCSYTSKAYKDTDGKWKHYNDGREWECDAGRVHDIDTVRQPKW